MTALMKTRWPAWAAVTVIAAVWLAAHLMAFLEAGDLFNADAAVAGLSAGPKRACRTFPSSWPTSRIRAWRPSGWQRASPSFLPRTSGR